MNILKSRIKLLQANVHLNWKFKAFTHLGSYRYLINITWPHFEGQRLLKVTTVSGQLNSLQRCLVVLMLVLVMAQLELVHSFCDWGLWYMCYDCLFCRSHCYFAFRFLVSVLHFFRVYFTDFIIAGFQVSGSLCVQFLVFKLLGILFCECSSLYAKQEIFFRFSLMCFSVLPFLCSTNISLSITTVRNLVYYLFFYCKVWCWFSYLHCIWSQYHNLSILCRFSNMHLT